MNKCDCLEWVSRPLYGGSWMPCTKTAKVFIIRDSTTILCRCEEHLYDVGGTRFPSYADAMLALTKERL